MVKQAAIASEFFDEVKVFSMDDLDYFFVKHFEAIFGHIKGGDYWIWKPYLIKKEMDSLENGDVLVCMDDGCELNPAGRKRFEEYLRMLQKSTTGVLAFELPHKEIEYTKKEVLDYFDVSQEAMDSNQLMATILLFRKCNHSVRLVEQWFRTLFDKPALFTDESDQKQQYPAFIAHRHDQSIFSLIRKIHGADIIPDETCFLDFEKEGKTFPFLTTRKRD